jgi:hypothetical protein
MPSSFSSLISELLLATSLGLCIPYLIPFPERIHDYVIARVLKVPGAGRRPARAIPEEALHHAPG